MNGLPWWGFILNDLAVVVAGSVTGTGTGTGLAVLWLRRRGVNRRGGS